MQSQGVCGGREGERGSADPLGLDSRHVTSDQCGCPQGSLSESSAYYGTLKSSRQVMGRGHSTTVSKVESIVDLVKWVQC